MDFKYIVRAETNEWSEIKNIEELKDKTFISEFVNQNPFVAREQAFLHAESFVENFFEADKAGGDYFFKSKGDVYKEFVVSVSLLNNGTGEEILIHKNAPFDEEGLHLEFIKNPFYLSDVLPGLEREAEYLRKQNEDVSFNAIIITLHDQTTDKTRKIEVIPTKFINKERIEIVTIGNLL
jgi:hypothetical protein